MFFFRQLQCDVALRASVAVFLITVRFKFLFIILCGHNSVDLRGNVWIVDIECGHVDAAPAVLMNRCRY